MHENVPELVFQIRQKFQLEFLFFISDLIQTGNIVHWVAMLPKYFPEAT